MKRIEARGGFKTRAKETGTIKVSWANPVVEGSTKDTKNTKKKRPQSGRFAFRLSDGRRRAALFNGGLASIGEHTITRA